MILSKIILILFKYFMTRINFLHTRINVRTSTLLTPHLPFRSISVTLFM